MFRKHSPKLRYVVILVNHFQNANAADGMKAFNSQQLEECDAFPDDTAVMLRFDGETHQATHQVCIQL